MNTATSHHPLVCEMLFGSLYMSISAIVIFMFKIRRDKQESRPDCVPTSSLTNAQTLNNPLF